MKELDMVVLKDNLPEHSLKAGDVGTVVHVYENSDAVEVEFATGDGQTIGVVTLLMRQIRIMQNKEILHARAMEAV